MAQVLKFKKPRAAQRHRGKTLCKNGFHSWEIDQQARFDVKQGKLVTRERCRRCGVTRVRSR